MKIKAGGREIEVQGVYGDKLKRDGREYPALRFLFPGEVSEEDVHALTGGEMEFGGMRYEGYNTMGGVAVTVAKITTAEEQLAESEEQLAHTREIVGIITGDADISADAAKTQRAIMEVAAQSLSGNDALKMKAFYPAWEELVRAGQVMYDHAGYKFMYGDALYFCLNANPTFQEDWVPGEGTAAMYTQIDEEHTGAEDDPIPYSGNMVLYSGKYYSQDGVTYRCIRDSGVALHNSLAELAGDYVEIV